MARGKTPQDDQRQKRFEDFLVWFKANITGKERAQGQIFFDRLLQAFGNGGVLEAGAVCENPVKKKSGNTGFADLVWKPRVIIELKERGTNLKKHYSQAEEYWMHLVPNRPQFMVLCNFDEFWIYDLNTQLNDPVHTLRTENIAKDWGGLGFLFPTAEKPIFTN
ncbi:MAG: type IIL restriction-modification enzyme MmeI, partial [Bdellovibrionota bacterium]